MKYRFVVPISRDIEHVQIRCLRQLWRYPRQSVLSNTEDIQTTAAPNLQNRRDTMIRLHVS